VSQLRRYVNANDYSEYSSSNRHTVVNGHIPAPPVKRMFLGVYFSSGMLVVSIPFQFGTAEIMTSFMRFPMYDLNRGQIILTQNQRSCAKSMTLSLSNSNEFKRNI
jgi:hypothetical protein